MTRSHFDVDHKVFMLVYIPGIFVGAWVLDHKGLRVGVRFIKNYCIRFFLLTTTTSTHYRLNFFMPFYLYVGALMMQTTKVLCGGLFNVLGAGLRAGAAGGDLFGVCFAGQTLLAIAQLFILEAPPKLSG